MKGSMNDARKYRVEEHRAAAGSLRVFGGETRTPWGACTRPRYLTRKEAWEQVKRCKASYPDAWIRVYCDGRKVWSVRPTSEQMSRYEAGKRSVRPTSEQMSRYEAGERLLHVRGEVIKALRNGAGWIELRALLEAEQRAKQDLAEAMSEGEGV